MVNTTAMPMCPMAKTCKGMMEKPHSGLMLMLPGIAFIILGLVIIMQPQILVWLIAIALIVMGIAMLMMANFMRKLGSRAENMRA